MSKLDKNDILGIVVCLNALNNAVVGEPSEFTKIRTLAINVIAILLTKC